MLDDRPQADRILIAQLHGAARHHARWRELTADEHAAAVGELRELAGSRPDLLAHVAGILEGFSEGKPDEPRARQAASRCRDAGADEDEIPTWIEEGRRRAAAAGSAPFSRASGKRPQPGGGASLVAVTGTQKPLAGLLLALRRISSPTVQHHLDRAHGPIADNRHISAALLVAHEPEQAEQSGEHDEQYHWDNRGGPYDHSPRAGRHQHAW